MSGHGGVRLLVSGLLVSRNKMTKRFRFSVDVFLCLVEVCDGSSIRPPSPSSEKV